MIQLGQTVVLVPIGDERRHTKEPREAAVTRVGRKYFDAEIYAGQPIQFLLEGNTQKPTGYGYGADWVLYESWGAYNNWKEFVSLYNGIHSQFSPWGIDTGHRKRARLKPLTLEMLRRITAILDGEA